MRLGEIIADYCIPLTIDGIEISIGYLKSELGFSYRQGSCADTNYLKDYIKISKYLLFAKFLQVDFR